MKSGYDIYSRGTATNNVNMNQVQELVLKVPKLVGKNAL